MRVISLGAVMELKLGLDQSEGGRDSILSLTAWSSSSRVAPGMVGGSVFHLFVHQLHSKNALGACYAGHQGQHLVPLAYILLAQ